MRRNTTKSISLEVFSILLITSLFGCTANEGVDASACRELAVELKHQDVKLEDLFAKVEVIPLETSDSCLIKEIGRVIETDSFIYLFDVNRVLKFNSDGSFVNSIGRRGRGPGEYIYVTDFDIDKSNGDISILCPFGYVYDYASDGKFIDRHSLAYRRNYQNLVSYNDTCWMTWTSTDWDEDDTPVAFVDKDFSRVLHNHRVPVHNIDILRADAVLTEYKGRLYAGFMFGPNVFEIRPDTVIKRFEWNFGNIMTSEETFVKYDKPLDTNPEVNMSRDREFFSDLGIRCFFGNYQVTDRYAYVRVRMNADFDKSNPPKDLELTCYRILYDLKDDRPYVFDGLNGGMLQGNVKDMTDDYLLEVVEPERFKFYKDYLPEGMTLEDIDVEEANPMLAKFYFKRK